MEGKLFVNLGDILIRIHNGTMGYFYIKLGVFYFMFYNGMMLNFYVNLRGYFISSSIMAWWVIV